MVKNSPAKQEMGVPSLGWEDPLEKEIATHSSILAWEVHGHRSLVGYSPWGQKSQTRLSKQSTAHKTIKMTLVRPLMTNFKVIVRADWAVSAWSRSLSIKALVQIVKGRS